MATDQAGSVLPENVSDRQAIAHIALLLPLESGTFAEAAAVVRDGFSVAMQRGQPLPFPVRLYTTTDDPLDILFNYHQAVSAGAVFIVGPLTRDGVSAIASSHALAVPTLALNTTDVKVLPEKLYLFGLQTEAEASQVAGLALANGRKHAILVGDEGSLSRRLQHAFSQRWVREAGNTTELIRYTDNPELLQHLRSVTQGDDQVVFLALDAARSRVVRTYLDPETPVYATSLVFTGTDNALLNSDLNGIRFLDMPWLLQPDHPAVMAYRHSAAPKSTDMERLYALGIDAFRLTTNLLLPQVVASITIDGVTGNIRFVPPNQFVRESLAARIEDGKVQFIPLSNHSGDER
ncbi:MAG: penicillin-binding protein activator [Nitrosomonas sp.]|nr:MAG: penicillin-binding protein activator [Nitrosomonas sp.]